LDVGAEQADRRRAVLVGDLSLRKAEQQLAVDIADLLTAQLRELETDGIVCRKVKRASPPQVTYSLTRAGEELIEPMSALCAWGTRYLGIPPSLQRYPKP